MAKESTWWDGFTDGLGELSDGVSGYFNAQAESEKAKAEQARTRRAVSENATLTEQTRIANLHQSQQSAQQQTLMKMGGGALILVLLLLLIFKK
ncbi:MULTISPECIES: hypothetical protein [Vibrio]|uniref:hypothetical protein n=1 Tax=Vibrio TaxID=662 RepID=UPI0033781243|nr:conserved hypothetical protein [Vibrio chagasii]CAH7114509.1 conserved hypothetical protein [Vibrio chagasii]CAH7282564.1 conserved hypothetical protein [Vibrio chagasii]CAH7305075.1 conserved hypothetical protein [Vibrio chagasii]CAH7331873.1 conserved hypothetical protein [Vibrio chagasii]